MFQQHSGNQALTMRTLHCYFAISRACNLDCRYCYIPRRDRRNQTESDDEVLDALALFLKKAGRERVKIASFCFHGAEPLTRENGTIALAVKMVRRHTRGVVGIQTNGINLDGRCLGALFPFRKWLDISVSLDGPGEIHDRNRGRNSERIWENIVQARSMGFSVRVVAGLTALHLRQEPAFVQWIIKLKREGIPFKFKLIHERSVKDGSATQTGLATLLKKHRLSRYSQLSHPRLCSNRGNRCEWYEFGVDGGVYSCNFALDRNRSFGNWRELSFAEIIRRRKKLYSTVAQSKKCDQCPIRRRCHSGCPLLRESNGRSYDCVFRKTLAGL